MKFTTMLAVPLLLALTAGAAVTSESSHAATQFVTVKAVDENYAVISGKATGGDLLGMIELATPKIVYATGGADPRGQALVPTGETFDFTDPNGASWAVRAYTFGGNFAYGVDVGETHDDETIGEYNFVLIVDSQKLGGAATLFLQ
jgi:hypothetical protein